MIRLLLVDDQALVRAGLRVLFEGERDIAVTGEAANGEEALTLARHYRPDVVLMDIRMPGLDGLEATRRIVGEEQLSGVRVLVLTTFEIDEYVFEALRAGASGFLLKDTEPSELIHAVRVVAAGDALLSPSITRRLIGEFVSRPAFSARRRQPCAARGSHHPRARGDGASGSGAEQRRDLRATDGQPGYRQDTRQPRDDQAWSTRPRAARGDGVRDRPGACRSALSARALLRSE